MADTQLPFQRSARHVLNNCAATGLQAVITGKEHLQTAAVRAQKVHRYRIPAVVSLPDKATVLPAQRDGRIDALGQSRAFEDDISALCSDLLLSH